LSLGSNYIFLIFFNQQFITWSIRADYSSYFVTILNKTKYKRKRKEKKERKRLMKNITNIAAKWHTHVILSPKEKAL